MYIEVVVTMLSRRVGIRSCMHGLCLRVIRLEHITFVARYMSPVHDL